MSHLYNKCLKVGAFICITIESISQVASTASLHRKPPPSIGSHPGFLSATSSSRELILRILLAPRKRFLPTPLHFLSLIIPFISVSVCICLCEFIDITCVRVASDSRGHQLPCTSSYKQVWATNYGCWDLNPGLLGEQPVFSETPLHPSFAYFKPILLLNFLFPSIIPVEYTSVIARWSQTSPRLVKMSQWNSHPHRRALSLSLHWDMHLTGWTLAASLIGNWCFSFWMIKVWVLQAELTQFPFYHIYLQMHHSSVDTSEGALPPGLHFILCTVTQCQELDCEQELFSC